METIEGMSRRDFLKLLGLTAGGLSIPGRGVVARLADFPSSERLGRVAVGKVDLKSLPDVNSQTVGVLYEDAVVPWIREMVGAHPLRITQRWVETPDGYIWAPYLQPVENRENKLVESLPETSLGRGMWAEVTVPWVDIFLENPPARSPWLKENERPRLYYSQILWVDQIEKNAEGATFYRVNERYGYGDIFWAAGEAFRPITSDEMEPVSSEVNDKRVIVSVTDQTLSCFEGGREVYFCTVSTGAQFNAVGERVDEWATPIGAHPVWRKLVSLHMSGGTTGGGYDLPGIGWTTLFVGNGVAIHSTFWHNNFGVPMSHGCVNARPADAKWVFRWVHPTVSYDPGDITVPMPGGTIVEVVER